MQHDDVPRLMTVNDFAEAASLAAVTVRKMIAQRRLASTKIGRSRRVPASELTRIIEQGLNPAEAPRE